MDARPSLTITAHDADGITVIRVNGEIDLATAPTFRAAVDQALAGGGDVHLDLSGVEFIDSTGITILIELRKHHAGRARLSATSSTVDRLLQLTGLTSLRPGTDRQDVGAD